MTKSIEFYYDFSSPYTYIAHKKIREVQKKSAIKFWGLYWASLHYLSYIYPDDPSNEQKDQIYK